MPKKAPREVKLANRATRKATSAERKANRSKPKSFLNDEQKGVIRKHCEDISPHLHQRSVVIDTICDMPDSENIDVKVKIYMEEHHIKKHVVHEVVELFKGYKNATLKVEVL